MRAIRKILASIRSADCHFSLISPGDKIVVGVSGGKDSLVLVHALNLYRKFASCDFELRPVMLDLGFPHFDSEPARAYLASIGLDLFVADAKNVYPILVAHQKAAPHLPCSICSRMKKATINRIAKELGCNKVAFAHHAEDAIETLVMNGIYGGRIATFAPKMRLVEAGIDFIRPLALARERDIKCCAEEEKLPVMPSPCPSDGCTTREDIKAMLAGLYAEYPSARKNFLSMLYNYEREDTWGKELRYKIEGTRLSLKPVITKSDTLAMCEIRTEVFIVEQKVDPALEFDGSDKDNIHFLIYEGETAIGTIRYAMSGEGSVHISRFAILAPYRNRGYGKAALQHLMAMLQAKACPLAFTLHAQSRAVGFYEKLGFKKEGDEFAEANIPHFHMRFTADE